MVTDATMGDAPQRCVLIVDDTSSTRVYLRAILEHAGLLIHEAASGEEGLQHLRDHRHDLVLLDMSMPGMDGADMLRTARAEVLDLPKVAMMSADDSAAMRSAAASAGVHTLLKKPVQASTVLDLLKPATRG